MEEEACGAGGTGSVGAPGTCQRTEETRDSSRTGPFSPPLLKAEPGESAEVPPSSVSRWGVKESPLESKGTDSAPPRCPFGYSASEKGAPGSSWKNFPSTEARPKPRASAAGGSERPGRSRGSRRAHGTKLRPRETRGGAVVGKGCGARGLAGSSGLNALRVLGSQDGADFRLIRNAQPKRITMNYSRVHGAHISLIIRIKISN